MVSTFIGRKDKHADDDTAIVKMYHKINANRNVAIAAWAVQLH